MKLKNNLIVFFVVLFLGACAPTKADLEPVSEKPTSFVCFLHGEKVIDTNTLHGASYDRETIGGLRDLYWMWEDEGGFKSRPVDNGELSCAQEGLSYSDVIAPSEPLQPSEMVCTQDGVEILRTTTIDGMTTQRVWINPTGDDQPYAYTWYEADGPHYLTTDQFSDNATFGNTLRCVDISVK